MQNDTPHRLNPKPLPPPGPPSDESLLESFWRSDVWRNFHWEYEWWEKPNNPLRTFMRNFRHVGYDEPTPHDVAVEITRLTHLVRSKWSTKGVSKRRKTLEAKKQGQLL